MSTVTSTALVARGDSLDEGAREGVLLVPVMDLHRRGRVEHDDKVHEDVGRAGLAAAGLRREPAGGAVAPQHALVLVDALGCQHERGAGVAAERANRRHLVAARAVHGAVEQGRLHAAVQLC